VYLRQVNIVNSGHTTTLWQRLRSQGVKWRYGFVQLPAVRDTVTSSTTSGSSLGSFTIQFTAVRGQGYRGDIALDDISARPGLCPSQGMCF
jgi:hypothetical protein